MTIRFIRSGLHRALPLGYYALFACTFSQAFTTIINVPPDPAPSSIGSNTQLNLTDGGSLPAFFDAGTSSGTSTDIEVNITGGNVNHHFEAYSGSEINISGGTIGTDFVAYTGSTLNISGGSFQFGPVVKPGATVNISGGDMTSGLLAGGATNPAMDTLLNISGGNLGEAVKLSYYTTANITGGIIGNGFEAGLSSTFDSHVTVNISGGVIGDPTAYTSYLGGLTAKKGTVVNLEGGTVSSLVVNNGSTFNISGGNIGQIQAPNGGSSHINFFGGEFELNGVPVAGLGTIGSSVTIDPGDFADGVLRSTLPDGSVHVTPLSGMDPNMSVTLIAAALPTKQAVVNVPADPAPRGLRPGQTLNLATGGQLNDYFNSVNAELDMSGGTIGYRLQVFDTVASISGGIIGDRFLAGPGSTVNVSGGRIGDQMLADTASVIHISGGHVGESFDANAGSTVQITGGSIGPFFQPHEGSQVSFHGGNVGRYFQPQSGSDVRFYGGELSLNGTPVSGLNGNGDTIDLELPPGSILTATLADGSVAIFSSLNGDQFGAGAVKFTATTLPPKNVGVINAPVDPAPRGLRAGQTLNAHSGTDLGSGFAAVDASLNLIGGTIGDDLQVFGTVVSITDGSVGEAFTVLPGSTVNISGGTIARWMQVLSNSTVNISGGEIGRSFQVGAFDGTSTGIVVNMSGGKVGDYSGAIEVYAGGTFNITGGQFGNNLNAGEGSHIYLAGGTIPGIFTAKSGSTVAITGGSIEYDYVANGGSSTDISGGLIGHHLFAYPESTINLFGSSFLLNGVDLTSSMDPGEAITLLHRDMVLEGLLADGSPFRIDLNSGYNYLEDYVDPNAILTLTLVPEPASSVILGICASIVMAGRRSSAQAETLHREHTSSTVFTG